MRTARSGCGTPGPGPSCSASSRTATAPGDQPAGPPNPTPERGMTETLDVDLKADPRPGFQARGQVAWEAGKLTLNPGGKLRRGVAVGSDARLTLALTFAPLDTDGQKS